MRQYSISSWASAYLGLGVVGRGLRVFLLGGALVDGLGRSESGAQQRLGATELDAGERERADALLRCAVALASLIS